MAGALAQTAPLPPGAAARQDAAEAPWQQREEGQSVPARGGGGVRDCAGTPSGTLRRSSSAMAAEWGGSERACTGMSAVEGMTGERLDRRL